LSYCKKMTLIGTKLLIGRCVVHQWRFGKHQILF